MVGEVVSSGCIAYATVDGVAENASASEVWTIDPEREVATQDLPTECQQSDWNISLSEDGPEVGQGSIMLNLSC